MIKVQEFLRRVVAFTSSAAVALQIVVQPLYAQSVVTDGGANGATVLITANGTPMVMVNTPNTQGLSHNTFDRFDVGSEGLILNNADQNYVLTNLAGYVQGNSAVSGGSASVILNEVTGTNASDLNGYMEVAGNTADVIVANAYGITCNGCGFINTDHVALTTGAPSISAGVLTGFSVEDGTIAIGELGADATGVSQFDLIARKVSFGGAVQGQNVRVVAGRNDVLYATGEATAKAADGSTAPDLAIDSTALGGMYANSITINSTEAGSGVRAPQTMSASAGGMHITADGRLVFGRAASTGNVTATADDIQVETFVKTDNALTIDAAGQLVLDTGAVVVAGTDAVLSAQDMVLGADAAVMGGNFLQIATAGLLDAGTGSNMLSYGDVTVTAGQFAAGMGALAYAGLTDGEGNAAVADLHFDITGDASFSGATMLATGNAQFDASQITIDATPLIEPSAFTGVTGLTFNGTGLSVGKGVALHSGADLGINLSGTMTLGDEAELMATDSISIGAGDATLSGAVLQAGSAIDLTARGTAVLDGNFLTSGVLSVSAETLTQSAGTMTGLLGVDLSATAGAMSLSGTVQSDAGIDLTATGDLTQTASGLLLSTGGNLSLTADGAAELNGSLKALGNIAVSGQTATLAGDVLAGLTVDAQATGGALNQSGSIEAGAVKLTASADLSNSGTVIGIADLQAGGNFSNSGAVEGDALSVTAADFANTGTGVLRANNTLVFTLTGSFDNAGDLEAGTGIQVTAADELTNSGSIESTGVVILTGSDLSNTVSGQIEADSITVDLSGALVSAGTIGAVQDVLLTAGSVNNSGSIIAQAASQIETATLRNSGTISVKGGGLWLTGLAQFNNTSGTILSDTGISIATSQALTIGASGWGSVSTDGWMTLAGLNGGALPSLTVNAGAELVAGDNLTIIAGAVTNAGTLASVNGNLVITSTAGISNSGLVYAGGNWLLLRANGTITNDGGTLLALNNLGICGNSTDDCLAVFGTDRAAALTNKNGGQIEAITGDVLIAADVINNGLASDVSVTEVAPQVVSSTKVGSAPSCGILVHFCDETYTYYIETHSQGSISATRNVSASTIVAGGNISFDADTITNAYSLISARGDISLSAGSVTNLGVKTGTTDVIERDHYKWVDVPASTANYTDFLGSDDPVVTFTQTGHLFGTIEAGGAITGTIPGALSNGVLTDNQTTFDAASASEPSLSTPTFTLLSIAAVGVSEAAQPSGAGGLTFNADTLTNPTLASLGLSDIAGLSNDQLFTVNADPVSGYLIETKPDFIDLNNFLGSEYFTDSLGFDPEVTQLRLGDALVETYLIRNQLYNLTGHNILDPTLSEKEQLKAMYDNAINAYESLDLRPGIALSPDQIALLTDDIIWPEEHLINGVKVLVPHVYLASATIDRFSNGAGAQIAGTRIALNTGSILNQGGSIRAEEDLILFASADIDNLFGEISAGNRLAIAADGDFTSLSGLISGEDVGIQAANINIATALTDIGTGDDHIGIAGLQSVVRAGNNLSLSANDDLSIIGTQMVAGNDLALQAGGDITLGAMHIDRQHSATMEGGSFEMSQQQILASSLTAENGSLSITSARFDEDGQLTGGGDILLEATALSAGDDISIAAAAGDVLLGAGMETRATSSVSQSSGFLGSSSHTSQTFDANNQSTTLDAGGDVTVYGAENVISQGAQIAAGGDVALQAGNDLVLSATYDLHTSHTQNTSSGLFGLWGGSDDTSVRSLTSNGTSLSADNVSLVAGSSGEGNLTLVGVDIETSGNTSLAANGDISILAAMDQETVSESSSSYGLFQGGGNGFLSLYGGESGAELTDYTLVNGSSITAGGEISFDATGSMLAEAAQVQSGGDLTINVGDQLMITGVANTISTVSDSDNWGIGLSLSSSGSGVSLFAGYQATDRAYDQQQTIYTGSNFLAGGNQVIHTGNDVTLAGSALIAGGVYDTSELDGEEYAYLTKSETGGNLSITSENGSFNSYALENYTATEESSGQTQIGVTLSVSSSTLAGVQQVVDGIDAFGEGQGNLAALNDASAMLMGVSGATSVADNINALAAGLDKHASGNQNLVNGMGISASLGIGLSNSDSSSAGTSTQLVTGTIQSFGGSVTIDTGDDINLIATNLHADEDVNLIAADEVNILSGQEVYSNSNTADSFGFGVSFGIDPITGEFGTPSVYANAATSNSDGSGINQVLSHVDADGTLTIQSGGDTNIIGGVVTGNVLDVQVGGDLTVASVQSTGTSDSSGANFDVSIGVGTGSLGVGGSDGSSNYAWVEEQSSLIGTSEADIIVAGHTQLDGGIIGTEATDGLTLETGTFGFTDIYDNDEAKDNSLNLSINGGSEGIGGVTVSGDLSNHDQEQTTFATVAGGEVVVTDEEAQAELDGPDPDEVNTDLDTAQTTTKDETNSATVYIDSNAIQEIAQGLPTINEALSNLDEIMDRPQFRDLTEEEKQFAEEFVAMLSQGECSTDHASSFWDFHWLVTPAYAGTFVDMACWTRYAEQNALSWLGLSDGKKDSVAELLASYLHDLDKSKLDSTVQMIAEMSGLENEMGFLSGVVYAALDDAASFAELSYTLIDAACDPEGEGQELLAKLTDVSDAVGAYLHTSTVADMIADLGTLGTNAAAELMALNDEYAQLISEGRYYEAEQISGKIGYYVISTAVGVKALAKGGATAIAKLSDITEFLRIKNLERMAKGGGLPDGYRVLDDSVGAARPSLSDGYRWVADADGNAIIQKPDGTFARTQAEIDSVVTGSGQYSGGLQKVNVDDPDADALADRIGGQSSVKFEGDPSAREFDAVSDQYVGQAKPANFQGGSSFRNQAKATFEAAQDTGREVYYHFDGPPNQSVIDKLNEYSARYDVPVVIDIDPF